MADNEQNNVKAADAAAQKSGVEKKPFGTSPGGLLWLGALGVSLLALVLYGLTLARYLYPGESAQLFTQWKGLDVLSLPLHPVWGWLLTTLGCESAVALNLVGLVCGVLSAGFICYLVGFFVYQSIGQEDTVKYARPASLLAGVGAAVVFVLSSTAWATSTHLDVRQFDVFLALAVFMLYVPLVRFPRLTYVLSPALGLAVAVGVAEGAVFVALVPVFLLALVATVVKNGFKFYVPVALFLVALVAGYMVLANNVADAFLQLPGASDGEFKESGDVLWACIDAYKREIHQWIFRPGGLVVALLAVLPFVACTFAAARGLNNERTWSQYLFHAAMTVCCVLATATPLSPGHLLLPFGTAPVATTALVAASCGYLLAYWFLLARVPLPVKEDEPDVALPVHKFGRQAAPFVGGGLALLLLLGGVVNAFSRDGENGAFADVCANELLDRMGTRTWLITDGLLDAHLRVAAAARGQELNIICIKALKESEYKAYCRQLADLVEKKGVTAGEKTSGDLAFSLRELGMVDFLKTWFSSDPDITKKVAVLRMSDFWFWAKCRPVPECLFFGGVADVKSVDGKKAKSDFEAFWKKMEPVLVADRRQGSRAIRDVEDPTDRCRLELRRHMGFVANNLGVLLQDLGLDAEAFEMYELVLGTIDCDNICALFNEYEMARAGKKEAQARKREIEQQLKGIVDDPSRRYQLRPLSSYYGYVRSPEFFVRSGLNWARSGETGYALEQIRYAIDLSSADAPPKELLNMMASYYAQGKQVTKSREKYQEVLAKDATNHEALIGLWRLSLQEGAVDEAKAYLERAVKAPVKEETARFDVALLHMMNNKLEDARLSLQKITDLQPHSIQAWALLAGVVLQQADSSKDDKQRKKILAEIDNVILPKMEALSDSPRDFFVQMTRALVLMRKGKDPETMKQTRSALELAWLSRPVVSVGGMLLDLDYRLLDRESAERHALQILRMDAGHAFANWVMGSIRMEAGKTDEAERFLRASVGAARPLPAAQNDLAELLRRRGDFVEAERVARAATRTDPKLYVAWETLCATLLDQGKDLDEAERCILKAIELSEGKDLRMQLTLARVQLAKKDLVKARGTLRSLGKRRDELAERDQAAYDELQKKAQGK